MMVQQDAKDTLIRDEYNDNARKKRRLDKDKADYETIKPREFCVLSFCISAALIYICYDISS
jgi:hypothetical protein